jgi:hypothetical protein
MLKKITYCFIILLAFTACKSKKIAHITKADKMLISKVLSNYNDNSFNKNTLKATLKAKYKGKSSLPSVNASLRLEKDKVIWISLSKSIFSLGKLKITPNSVQFYNKLDRTYFDGDFSLLSDFLGTKVNFKQVQNIFLGEAIFDLNKQDYKISTNNNNYEIRPKKENKLFQILFLLDAKNFKTSKQEIRQDKKSKLLSIKYNEYKKIDDIYFPKKVFILAEDNKNKNTVDISYKNVEFDLPLRFPFKIPKGYKEIKL